MVKPSCGPGGEPAEGWLDDVVILTWYKSCMGSFPDLAPVVGVCEPVDSIPSMALSNSASVNWFGLLVSIWTSLPIVLGVSVEVSGFMAESGASNMRDPSAFTPK